MSNAKFKINDSIALGAVCGILGNIPHLILDFASVQLGYSQYYGFQLSGSIYMTEPLTENPLGFVLGAGVWMVMAMFLGAVTVLIIHLSGSDYWWLKGILVTTIIMFVTIYGFLFNLGGARIVPSDIPTNLTVFIGNIIYGVAMGYLIVRWGDESLIKP